MVNTQSGIKYQIQGDHLRCILNSKTSITDKYQKWDIRQLVAIVSVDSTGKRTGRDVVLDRLRSSIDCKFKNENHNFISESPEDADVTTGDFAGIPYWTVTKPKTNEMEADIGLIFRDGTSLLLSVSPAEFHFCQLTIEKNRLQKINALNMNVPSYIQREINMFEMKYILHKRGRKVLRNGIIAGVSLLSLPCASSLLAKLFNTSLALPTAAETLFSIAAATLLMGAYILSDKIEIHLKQSEKALFKKLMGEAA